MKFRSFKLITFSLLALAFLSSSCKVTRVNEVHHHYGNNAVVENPINSAAPVDEYVPRDPVYNDEPIVYANSNVNRNNFDAIIIDDHDYYYSSRIRRFHRPYRGFGYYSNVYTDYHYYDPFYSGSSIYVVNDFWGPRGNWWNWNGPYANVGVNWGWGAGWHSGWGNHWGPGQYYGWGCRPSWNRYHHNHWGWNNGWNNGFNSGYQNGYWAGYWNGYRDGHWDNWWRSSANPGTAPDRNVYNGRFDRSGGRLASNTPSAASAPNGRVENPSNANVNVRPTFNPETTNNTAAGSGRNTPSPATISPSGSGRNNEVANGPGRTDNPIRSNNGIINNTLTPGGRNTETSNPNRGQGFSNNQGAANNSGVRQPETIRPIPDRQSNVNNSGSNNGRGQTVNPNTNSSVGQSEAVRPNPDRQSNGGYNSNNGRSGAYRAPAPQPNNSTRVAPNQNSSGSGRSGYNSNSRGSDPTYSNPSTSGRSGAYITPQRSESRSSAPSGGYSAPRSGSSGNSSGRSSMGSGSSSGSPRSASPSSGPSRSSSGGGSLRR